MGMQGAAWSTLIGRAVPVVAGVLLLILRPHETQFHARHLRPDWGTMKSILQIGWPSSAQLIVRIGAVLVFISYENRSNYSRISYNGSLPLVLGSRGSPDQAQRRQFGQ